MRAWPGSAAERPAVTQPAAHPPPASSLHPARRGEDGAPFAAACAALTEHFILLGLPDGTLAFYQATDCLLASEYAHTSGIEALFPSADGTM